MRLTGTTRSAPGRSSRLLPARSGTRTRVLSSCGSPGGRAGSRSPAAARHSGLLSLATGGALFRDASRRRAHGLVLRCPPEEPASGSSSLPAGGPGKATLRYRCCGAGLATLAPRSGTRPRGPAFSQAAAAAPGSSRSTRPGLRLARRCSQYPAPFAGPFYPPSRRSARGCPSSRCSAGASLTLAPRSATRAPAPSSARGTRHAPFPRPVRRGSMAALWGVPGPARSPRLPAHLPAGIRHALPPRGRIVSAAGRRCITGAGQEFAQRPSRRASPGRPAAGRVDRGRCTGLLSASSQFQPPQGTVRPGRCPAGLPGPHQLPPRSRPARPGCRPRIQSGRSDRLVRGPPTATGRAGFDPGARSGTRCPGGHTLPQRTHLRGSGRHRRRKAAGASIRAPRCIIRSPGQFSVQRIRPARRPLPGRSICRR